MNSLVNLKLVLRPVIENFDPLNILLADRKEDLSFKLTNNKSFITAETKVKLPNIIYITSKQPHIELKEFWLGNVKATDSMLNQISYFTSESINTHSTYWQMPGTIKIEIFDTSFIEFHLHYGITL